METQEKNEPCYVQNHEAKRIETKITVGSNIIEIVQRRLTGGEVASYENDLKNVYADKDVYLTLLKNQKNELKNKLEKPKKKTKNNSDLEVEIDDDTRYLLYKGRLAIESHNRTNNAKLIAYSCENSELYGGSFKFNGENVNFERKLKIINELGKDENDNKIDWFSVLLGNANKLSFPTEKEISDAKS